MRSGIVKSQKTRKAVGEGPSNERLVLKCTDGTTAVLRAGEVLWRCDADLKLESFLNSEWRLQSVGDSLQELALRLGKAVRHRGIVEVRRN